MEQIYFVDTRLGEEVHAQALGFTRNVMNYVYAADQGTAEQLATKWYQGKGIAVEKSRARTAVIQDLSTYTFPHQIINLPEVDLAREYERRQYPEHFRDPGFRVSL